MIKTLSIYILLFFAHILLVQNSILPGDLKTILVIDSIILGLFIFGLLVSLPGVKKGGENFSMRFLLVTTAQMLAMLSVILALTLIKIENVKTIGFSAISVFILFLIIQSFVLIKSTKKI